MVERNWPFLQWIVIVVQLLYSDCHIKQQQNALAT